MQSPTIQIMSWDFLQWPEPYKFTETISTPFCSLLDSTATSSQPMHTARPLVDSTSLFLFLGSDNRHMQCCVSVLLQGLLTDSDPVRCSWKDTDRSTVTLNQHYNSVSIYCFIYLCIYRCLELVSNKLTITMCVVIDMVCEHPTLELILKEKVNELGGYLVRNAVHSAL